MSWDITLPLRLLNYSAAVYFAEVSGTKQPLAAGSESKTEPKENFYSTPLTFTCSPLRCSNPLGTSPKYSVPSSNTLSTIVPTERNKRVDPHCHLFWPLGPISTTIPFPVVGKPQLWNKSPPAILTQWPSP